MPELNKDSGFYYIKSFNPKLDELSSICGQLKLYADDGKNMFLMS